MPEFRLLIWHNNKEVAQVDLHGDDTLTISLLNPMDPDTDLCGFSADGTLVIWNDRGEVEHERKFDLPKDCEYPNCHDYADDVVQGKDLCAIHAGEFRQLFGNNS